MVTKSRKSVLEELRLLAAGLLKNPTGGTTSLASETYDDAGLLARLQVSINGEAAVDSLRASLAAAIAENLKIREREAVFVRGYRRTIQIRHRNSITKLQQFGLEPPRANPKRTAEEKLLMTAKNHSTREKRGTLGPKEKAKIKGNVTGVVITPVRGKD